MEFLEWFYDIDYSSPVSERYEYKTDIIESWDGTEQRMSLLDQPDHILYNNYVLHKKDWIDARNKLNAHREKPFLVPNKNMHWVLRDVGAGHTYLEVPPWAFPEDSRLLLKGSDGSYSVHRVSYVGGSGVFVSIAVPRDYEWCECIRLDVYFLEPDIDFRVLAGDMVQATIAFKADEASYEIPLAVSDVEFFDGLPVLDFKHNFSQSLDHTEFYDDVGVGWGSTVKERINRAAGFDVRMTFDLDGGEIQRFKAFVHTVKGRQGAFWVKDHSSAFYSHSVGSGNQINVEKSRLAGVVHVPNRIVEITTGGGVFRRKIVDVIPTSTHEILILNEALPTAAHDSISSVAFLYVGRFLNDLFEYDFFNDQYARITKAVRAVRSWHPD